MENRSINEKEAIDNLNQCYYNIIKILKDYLDTNENNYKLIALWIIGTYFHKEFNTYPYLFFNAMRGSGKTRTLRLISKLGAKGDGSVQNNLTEAVLFRIPKGTTTCIDEVEQINKKEKQTLRELLNSAYKKGMKVKRMAKKIGKDGETQVAEVFEPYFPICMANINGVEEVLADRSIVLILEKSMNPAMVYKVEDYDTNEEIETTLRRIVENSVVCVNVVTKKNIIRNWNKYISNRYNIYNNTNDTNNTTHIQDNQNNQITTQITTQNDIYKAETNIMQFTDYGVTLKDKMEQEAFFNKLHDLGIIGRNFELFFPLLIIAKVLGDKEFEDISKIASSVVQNKKEEEFNDSKDVSLYEFISELTEYRTDFVSIKELTNRFRMYIGESDDEDAWLNDKWLGRALKRLNLIIDKRRFAQGRQVTLDSDKAKKQLKIFKGDSNDQK